MPSLEKTSRENAISEFVGPRTARLYGELEFFAFIRHSPIYSLTTTMLFPSTIMS